MLKVQVKAFIYFNPRTHKECDGGYADGRAEQAFISIHALTRSATFDFHELSAADDIFQSTHSQGVRRHHQCVHADR